MSYSIQRNPSWIQVTIQDELTVADVGGLRDELLRAAADPLPIIVDAKAAKRIDISIVQVLFSAQKSFGQLTIQECSAGVSNYLARAGVAIGRWSSPPLATAVSEIGERNG